MIKENEKQYLLTSTRDTSIRKHAEKVLKEPL